MCPARKSIALDFCFSVEERQDLYMPLIEADKQIEPHNFKTYI